MKQKHTPEMWAALYSAGALTQDELRFFEESLGEDPAHREELAKFDKVICALADGAGIGFPSAEIRDRLLRQIRQATDYHNAARTNGHVGVIDGQPPDAVADPAPNSIDSRSNTNPPSANGNLEFARNGLAENETLLDLATNAVWKATGIPGVTRRTLFHDSTTGRFSAILRLEAGATFPPHRHDGPEESLILEGELFVDGERLGPGDFQRHPMGSRHSRQHSPTGCVAFVSGIQILSTHQIAGSP